MPTALITLTTAGADADNFSLPSNKRYGVQHRYGNNII
jgi:hypothetical protein